MDVKKYWHDLRHVKNVEEASYNGAFEYANKHISDMNYSVFRDYARIFAIRNASHLKNMQRKKSLEFEIENDEIKIWMGIK